MTQELEHTLRRGYGNMTKNDLINHCIDLQRKIEHLEFRIACHDASDILHNVAKELDVDPWDGVKPHAEDGFVTRYCEPYTEEEV